MAISAFIPDIWSARFQDNLNKRLAYGSVFGRDHQGEVQDGDTVKIPKWSKVITVGDYNVDTDIAAAETADGSTVDVELNKKKYFNLQIDDVNEVQSKPSLIQVAVVQINNVEGGLNYSTAPGVLILHYRQSTSSR